MERFKRETPIWNLSILCIVPVLPWINFNDKILHPLGKLSQKSKLSILFHYKKKKVYWLVSRSNRKQEVFLMFN